MKRGVQREVRNLRAGDANHPAERGCFGRASRALTLRAAAARPANRPYTVYAHGDAFGLVKGSQVPEPTTGTLSLPAPQVRHKNLQASVIGLIGVWFS